MFKYVVLFFASFNCFAFSFGDWSDDDKEREATWLTFTVIDWLQTRNATKERCTNPYKNCEERGLASIFIGNHPSIGQVNNYFAATIIAHIKIVDLLPQKNVKIPFINRSTFQLTTISFEIYCDYHNYKLGISAEF